MFVRYALVALIIVLATPAAVLAATPTAQEAHLSVAPLPATVPIGTSLPITVRVRSSAGEPLSDVQVELLESGEEAWTNGEGEARFSFREDAPSARNLTFIARERFTTEGKQPLDAEPLKVSVNWSRVRLTVAGYSAIVPPDGSGFVNVPVVATWEHDGQPVPGAKVLAQVGNESLTLEVDDAGVAAWNATRRSGGVSTATFSLLTPSDYPANDASATVVWLEEFLDLHAGNAVALTADAPHGVAPHSVTFTVENAPPGWSFLVDFGDGFNTGWSKANELVHTYADPGAYTARVAAMDAEGRLRNVDAAASVFSSSPENKPPTVTVSPLPVVLHGTVEVVGSARDDDAGVSRVEWRVDNGPWQEAGGITDWSFDLPTTDYPNGAHRLFMRAVDAGHRTSEVAVVDVEILNGAVVNVAVAPSAPRAGAEATVACETAGAASVVISWGNETLDAEEVSSGRHEARLTPTAAEDVVVTCSAVNAHGDAFKETVEVSVQEADATPAMSGILLALLLMGLAVLRRRAP